MEFLEKLAALTSRPEINLVKRVFAIDVLLCFRDGGRRRIVPVHRVFPATRRYVDRLTAQRRRHHLHESVLQRAVKDAVRSTGIAKQATCPTVRHSCATHRLEESHDIRTVQELLGHQAVSPTMLDTHVLTRGPAGVRSPADRMCLS